MDVSPFEDLVAKRTQSRVECNQRREELRVAEHNLEVAQDKERDVQRQLKGRLVERMNGLSAKDRMELLCHYLTHVLDFKVEVPHANRIVLPGYYRNGAYMNSMGTVVRRGSADNTKLVHTSWPFCISSFRIRR